MFVAGFAAAVIASTASAAPDEVPYSTPPGLTVVDVPNDGHMFGYRRIGDAEGNFLFALKPDAGGKVSCAGDCAKNFAPLAASSGASAFDVWTIVDNGGTKQWAYQGVPLYRYVGSDKLDRITSPKADDPAIYWRVVSFRPDLAVRVPAGIKVHSLEVAAGYGLVDSETGAVMYNLSAAPKEPNAWRPVYAPEVALATGDFTVVKREDMSRQWAYRGHPLFTYRGDYSPDDINGVFSDPAASPALVIKHYMPESVKIAKALAHGPMMVTKDGLTVYTEGQYKLQYGGRSTRDGYYLAYDNAKAVGVRGCADSCLQTWRPVAAPADAQARGFWEVATRSDGTKQWVYKGAALYTYADDKKLGDMFGNNRHIIVYGDPVKDSIDLTPSGGGLSTGSGFERGFGSGFYWHHVMLYTQSVDRDNSKASFYE